MREEAEQFRDEAERSADHLLADEELQGHERPDELKTRPESGGTTEEMWGIADIGSDIRRMLEQKRIYDDAGIMFPGVVVDGEKLPVPIDVPSFVARVPKYSYGHFWRYVGGWPYHAHQMIGGMIRDTRIKGIPPDQVVDAARPSLVRSLANRLFGRTKAKTTSLFTLHCESNKVAVYGRTTYYMPAFFISLGPYGSVRSTPVTATIPTGYYFFGAEDTRGAPQLDRKKQRFDIPFNQAGFIDV